MTTTIMEAPVINLDALIIADRGAMPTVALDKAPSDFILDDLYEHHLAGRICYCKRDRLADTGELFYRRVLADFYEDGASHFADTEDGEVTWHEFDPSPLEFQIAQQLLWRDKAWFLNTSTSCGWRH